jgi:hypothetical protein
MDQYKKLIGTCRIPAKTIDRLYLYNKNNHHHVAIFYRNNVRKCEIFFVDDFVVLKVYRLPVYDDQGKKFSADMIYNHLKKLSDEKQSSTLIGHLTADERQHWAPIYAQLTSSKIEFEYKNIKFIIYF